MGVFPFLFRSKFDFTIEGLEKIIKMLDTSYTNVVKFRHSSWWNEEVYTQLARNKIIFCGISLPSQPDNIIVDGSLIYYCFLDVQSLYHSSYKQDPLKHFVDDIFEVPQLKEVNCFFNNNASNAAIENVVLLQNYCTQVNHSTTILL